MTGPASAEFHGHAVAVVGGAGGIGRATALRLAELGARVFVADADVDRLATLAHEAAQLGYTMPATRLDVRDPAAVSAFFEQVAAGVAGDIPGLSGMVAAVGVVRDRPALALTVEEWADLLSVNLTGIFLCVQAAARLMVAAGGGSIVTLSSGMAFHPAANLAHYSASKAGVVALTRAFALELGSSRVRVNTVAPGSVDTPMLRSRLSAEAIASWDRSPLGRIGAPDDVAEAILFLLSARSTWMTGQTLHVNGGTYMP